MQLHVSFDQISHTTSWLKTMRKCTSVMLCMALFLLLTSVSIVAQSTDRSPRVKTKKEKIPTPKLVVLLVVDQMRADYFERFNSDYAAGLKRLWNEGAVFLDAEHHHAMTATAAGHASISTGMFPSHNGIVGNNFYDRALGKSVYSAFDTFPSIGHPWADSASPRRQSIDGLGDFLKAADPKSKSFGLSLKDRSSIFTAGRRANAAFRFDDKTGHFVTSTYYMNRLPAWLERFNRSAVRNRWRKTAWEPIAPAETYNESGVDSFFYESDGKSIAFPHKDHITADSSDYFENLLGTPFADELALIAAESLLVAEQLGKDRSIDLLSVSLSAADYLGHSVGPNAKELQDYYLRLDRTLESFISFVNQTIGKENWILVLTSDHGVLPIPEYLPALNMEGRRVMSDLYKSNIKRLIASDPELQSMRLADMPIKFAGLDIVLDANWLGAKRKGSMDDVLPKVAQAVSRSVDIEAVFTRTELMSTQPTGKPHEELVRNSFDPRLSADLIVVTKPGVLVSSAAFGTSHLTPHDYDRKVPIVFFGSGICARKISELAYTVDIVPTLVEMLGLKTKGNFDGRSRASVVRCR